MPALPRHLTLQTEQDTIALADFLAPLLEPGDVLCLSGNLGSGKTFFAAALGRALGIPEPLDSPSFVLLKEYRAPSFPLYHLDLYRLNSTAELMDLGILDWLEHGVTLIEWPELAAKLLPEEVLNLELRFSFDGFQRCVDIVAAGPWAAYFI